MKSKVASYEAKNKLPEFLRRVEAGESFTITNHGKVVADLIPADSRRQRAKLAIANIKRMKKHVVSNETLMDLRQQGR
ncbi:type II toxin-antitoxin system Phd/YefM family antitoxin [Spartinivicinus poritis]|uniref:Antitoxin n=1 Tax=Spartinivicinus poritis TaxID=2994640 RepID=A0ABT5UHQ5_9GAMM|nr:type II toxin-antitoxin system prevent-host-death family antitoxin [Spartinivicinus sp. A2-2]MDE1465526.1 type II toxin-antitoxin system prevent-host-death family antitoxin [Spartinivicinus sp. A2-2]